MRQELYFLNKLVEEGILHNFEESLERITLFSQVGLGKLSNEETTVKITALDSRKSLRRQEYLKQV